MSREPADMAHPAPDDLPLPRLHDTTQGDEVNAEDRRPHSRACGWRPHDHGNQCHRSCPTCGGMVASERPADEETSTDTPAPSQAATEAHGDERLTRYAQTIAVALANVSALPDWVAIPALGRDMRPLGEVAARKVTALADAEQAELRAENERLTRALDDAWTGWQHDTNELTTRAEKAEAKVAELRRIIMQGGQDAASVRREAMAALDGTP